MASKLNHAQIAAYAQKFANLVCNRFFASQDAITGKQIVELCENQQINFFVVKTIFMRWQEESANIKSPFFNYSDPEVAKAMATLMNVLSRNISLQRPALEPILAEAVVDTLTLTLSPSAYYIRLLQSFGQQIDINARLRPIAKYVKIHRHVFDMLLARLDREAQPVAISQAIATVEKTLSEPLALDEPEKIFESLASVIPVRPKDFIMMDEDPLAFSDLSEFENNKFDVAQLQFGLDVEENQPNTEQNRFNSTYQQPPVQKQQPPVEPRVEPQVEPRSENWKEAWKEEMPQNYKDFQYPPKEEKPTEEKPINERFSQENVSLNDKLATQNRNESLYEMHNKAKIPSLKSYIPLNKKFVFINELFGGNSREFEEAIEIIDQCADYHKAIMIIKDKYFRRFNWDLEKDEVKEFYEMVSRKF